MRAIALALILACGLPAFAQQKPHDGNWWNTLESNERMLVLAGFVEGMELGKSFSIWEGTDDGKFDQWAARADQSFGNHWKRYMVGTNTGQLRDGLNVLYTDFRNRNIALPFAMWIVVNQIGGTPEAEVQILIEAFVEIRNKAHYRRNEI
jgi:hypothetical protein